LSAEFKLTKVMHPAVEQDFTLSSLQNRLNLSFS
jgi:hypothetical protein